jgi:hypothetical protein
MAVAIATAEVDRHMMATPASLWPARHISVAIDRPAVDVYDWLANPTNLPRWAQGLAASITPADDGTWVASSPMGTVRIRFAARNGLGVLDHDVTLDSGVTIHNPMRVLPNAGGSEVVFTLFHRPEMTQAELDADAVAVTRDLQALKTVLESARR